MIPGQKSHLVVLSHVQFLLSETWTFNEFAQDDRELSIQNMHMLH